MSPDVLNAVHFFADFLLQYFIALAAVGAFAMALVELWKKVRASQTRYHAKVVTAWFAEDGQTVASAMAYAELLQLTTGVSQARATGAVDALVARGRLPAGLAWVQAKPEHALFALTLEQMMGHIQDAVDLALNHPRRYEALYRHAVRGAPPADIERWREQAHDLPGAPDSPADRAQVRDRADLYARLSQVAKRRLDALQVYASQRWVNGNQFWANVVGVVVLFFALHAVDRTLSWPALIGLSILGGVLAPVAKDIVVALRKVRERV